MTEERMGAEAVADKLLEKCSHDPNRATIRLMLMTAYNYGQVDLLREQIQQNREVIDRAHG